MYIIATTSNPDLQVNTITTMCNMTYLMTLPTYASLITVSEIVRKSSCKLLKLTRNSVSFCIQHIQIPKG